MYRSLKLFSVLFLLVIFIAFAIADGNSTQSPRECKGNCTQQKKERDVQCNKDYSSCYSSCLGDRKLCFETARSDFNLCKSNCLVNSSNTNQCKKDCNVVLRTDLRECNSNFKQCKDTCRLDHKECKKNSLILFNLCSNECLPKLNVTSNEYNFTIGETTCVDANGLYQQLCKGQYFRLMCSGVNYCQCNGFGNYSCPSDYQCITNHGLVVQGRSNFDGFVNYLGQDLGPIGICGQPL